ncbi:MAG: sigma-70 family RNA polymerase sigma factor [Bacteroidia bacterium]|nr:sigma-70 family RNA polymerase sigma factor [Bacteroidia bacterium]
MKLSETHYTHKSWHSNEDALVYSLKNKDPRALTYLYQHYAGPLLDMILRVVKLNAVAEEILQDVFLKIWEKMARFDPQRGSLSGWMFCIGRNLALDKLRSREYRQQGRDTYTLENPHLGMGYTNPYQIRVDHIGLQQDLLDKLPPEQARLVCLVHLMGYTQTEAAEKLNLPLGTVKTRLRLAMSKLRKKLLARD